MLIPMDRETHERFHALMKDPRHTSFHEIAQRFVAFLGDGPSIVFFIAGSERDEAGRPQEFNFAVHRAKYVEFANGPRAWDALEFRPDRYPSDRREPDCSFIMNGGWINHGTEEDPRWSSHT